MKEIVDLLCSDALHVLVCYAVFLIAYVANVVLSLYANIKIKREPFDYARLLEGLVKALVLVLGTLLLVVAVDLASIVFIEYAPDISEQVHDLVTIAAILLTIGVAACIYIKQAYETFRNILVGNK